VNSSVSGNSVITEEGWTQTGSPGYTTDPTVQAKYDSRALLYNAAEGVPTYLYQAMDTTVADDGTWGLFNTSAQANPAGVTISNMNQIIDNGSTSPDSSTVPTDLKYSITGDTSNVDQLVVQNGSTTDLILWSGVQSSDATEQQQVQVNLSGVGDNAQIFNPTYGLDAVDSYSDTNSIPVTVEDQPIIVQLSS
jgi:hypothetical protein